MTIENPGWIAPRKGQDWRDDDVLLATAWLTSLVNSSSWRRRLDATAEYFRTAKARWASGEQVPLFDSSDTAAWIIFQGNAFANDRANWVPEEAVRIAPILTRIGRELPALLSVDGVEDRAARLMTADRSQPDGGLFELIVALAYKRHGWRDVRFVPEQPGISKTSDLLVSAPRRRWAVECKRLSRSGYAAQERARGEALAKPVHELSLASNRSLIMRVAFLKELSDLSDDHLATRAAAYIEDPRQAAWETEESFGYVRDVDWRLAHSVFAHDDVYFGSSRMIELLIGRYDHDDDHSMAAKWRPGRHRPYYASMLYQASVVSWRSKSFEAVRRKVRHFRAVVAKAAAQLPGDRPGAVHVGTETWGNANVDELRHIQNYLELSDFDSGASKLRWVFGNYFSPELTTRRDESWAVNETMVPYKIGRHRTARVKTLSECGDF